MSEVFEVCAHRLALSQADVSAGVVPNSGAPIPHRYTAAHRLCFDFVGEAGRSYPTNKTRYVLPASITAGGLVSGALDGQALSLAAGYLVLPALVGLDARYTLSLSLSLSDLSPGENPLITALDASGAGAGLSFSVDATTGAVALVHGAMRAEVAAGLPSSGRARLDVVWDGASVTVYVDGGRVGAAGLSEAPAARLSPAVLGAQVSEGPAYASAMSGRLFGLHVFSAALSALEVSVLSAYERQEATLNGQISGSPTACDAPSAQVRQASSGLSFDGASAVRAATLPGSRCSLAARWMHNAAAVDSALCGVGTVSGIWIEASASGGYVAHVGEDQLSLSGDFVDGEVLAAVVGAAPRAQEGVDCFFELVGSLSGRHRVERDSGGPWFNSAPQLSVADAVGQTPGYTGAVFDVSWWPYLALNEGQVATYTRGFIRRPETPSGTEIEVYGFDLADTPPEGEADPPVLEELSPAPLEPAAPVDSVIRGAIVDEGDGLDLSSIKITVAGVLAYEDGAIRGGFMGTVTPEGTERVRFSLIPPERFSDVVTVSVRVEARDVSPLSNVLDTTYSFVTADASPPFITNQTPAPAQTLVPQNSNITLRVTDLASSVVRDSLSVVVREGGEDTVAVAAGLIQAPFDGSASQIVPAGRGFDIILDKTTVLAEASTVQVLVTAQDDAGNALSAATYSFSTGDQTAPSLVCVAPAEIGASDVSPLSSVVFELVDLGTGVDRRSIEVTVDQGAGPEQAVVGGVFVSPFNGPDSAIVATGQGYRVTIDPVAQLPNEQLVALSVRARDAEDNQASLGLFFTTGTAGTIDLPIELENDGGGPVSLLGTVPPGRYRVTVEAAGAPPVYNGRPGSGGLEVVIEEMDGGKTDATAPVYFPPLPAAGAPYGVTFTPLGSEGSPITTPPCVYVTLRGMDSKTLQLRSALWPTLNTGPREAGQLSYPQE